MSTRVAATLNTTAGAQTLTIRDPSSARRCVIPTHARGVYRTAENQKRASDRAPPDKLERSRSAKENIAEEGDFHSSSRN